MSRVHINNNKKLFEGAYKALDATAVTLGLGGGFGVLENPMQGFAPIVTKDGVSVIRSISFSNAHKRMGADIVKQACLKSLIEVGDGTTTTAVLTKGILDNSFKFHGWLDNKGYRHFNSNVKKGMDEAYREVVDHLQNLSLEITDSALEKIASISANNNPEAGKTIVEAYKKVGKSGIINVEQASSQSIITVDVSKGMKIDKGWVSPFLVTDGSKAIFEAENAAVLIYEGVISPSNAQDIAAQLEKYKHQPILIICEQIATDTIINIEKTHQTGKLSITVIEADKFGEERRQLLSDIAAYTDGEVFLQGTSKEYVFGQAKKIRVEKNSTQIIQDSLGNKAKERLEDLQNGEQTDFVKKRIANFTGGVATIKVGDINDVSRKELFDLIDDAVHAIKSAQEEGYVAGGGATFTYISGQMKTKLKGKDEQFGYNIIKNALNQPFYQICENSNADVRKFHSHSRNKYGVGFNAATGELEDMFVSGIIDSTKSLRVSLENALSVAKILLNIKVSVALS